MDEREDGGCREVVALMGSYRRGGTIDRAVDEVLAGAAAAGARTRKIVLVERRVEHCRNCRECCQEPGEARGRCALDDDAPAILDALEQADAIVLGAPVNFGDVNALTRTLLERMVGYAYWPWGQPAPKPRRKPGTRPAVLVTSSAAPGVLARFLMRPLKTLKQMATLLGAKPVGRLVIGYAGERGARPDARQRDKARELGRRLLARA